MSRQIVRVAPITYKSDMEIEKVPEDADVSGTIDVVNKLISSINYTNKFVSIQGNFDGYIAKNVTIRAGDTVTIQHFLGLIPKWRIILRQTGNGVITDVPSQWTDKVISLKNNGAEDVEISVFIARE